MGGIFTFRVIGLGENPKRNYPMIFTLSQTHCTYKNVIRTGFKDFMIRCGLRIRVIFIFHFDAVVGYFKNIRRAGHISIKLECCRNFDVPISTHNKSESKLSMLFYFSHYPNTFIKFTIFFLI